MNANQAEAPAFSAYCPVFQGAVELIGRRWTGAIVRALLTGSNRFGEVLSRVPGLSDRLLSERLRELEQAGIVRRIVYPEVPVRIEYELTEKGRELEGIVASISNWADKWRTEPAEISG
ncbi:MAG: winged helix-turn-helix transcriptional regulator [Dehalococcoidia bacterium]